MSVMQPWKAVTESGRDTFSNELQCSYVGRNLGLSRLPTSCNHGTHVLLSRSRNLWTHCQRAATLKGTCSYVGHWDCHACQRAATMERTFSYLGRGIRSTHVFLSTESGMNTFANELQPWKAHCPMSVTESGMDTFANELRP